MIKRPVLFALALLSGAAPAALAQSDDGYLFHQPAGLFTVRGGYSVANAGGDLYNFARQNLTLNRSDFNAITGAFDFSFAATPRMDVAFGLGLTTTSARSEFRNYVDNNNQAIQQKTALRTIPLSTTLRYYLKPRGRSLGRYAWVPSRIAPYVGLGGGIVWYTFRQTGDFVDFQTLNIFNDSLVSTGRSLMGVALAGVNIAMGLHWALTGEMRYVVASAPMQRDFVGFHQIDLSGLSFTGGISVRLAPGGVR